MNMINLSLCGFMLMLVLLNLKWGIARYKFTRDPNFYIYLVKCKHNQPVLWWTGMWELTFWHKTIARVRTEAAKDGIEIFT